VATKRLAHFDSRVVKVCDLSYQSSEIRDVYVVGAGKATFPVAKALEEILGDRIRDGIILLYLLLACDLHSAEGVEGVVDGELKLHVLKVVGGYVAEALSYSKEPR